MITNSTTRLKTMQQCYDQAGPWEDGTILRQHEREKQEAYTRRCAGIYSPSLYTYLIDTFDVVYSKEVNRTNYSDMYGAFIEDAGYGSNLSTVLKLAMKQAMVQGSSFIVMDTLEDQPTNLQDVITQRSFPFIEVIEANQVTSILMDKLGNLRQFGYTVTEDLGFGEATYTKIYTQGYVEYLDYEGAIAKSIELPYNILPVIPVVPNGKLIKNNELPSSSTMGLYQGQYSIASTFSLIDESLYSQQFSVLVVSTKDDLQNVTLGTSHALKLSEGSTATFIAPTGTPVDLMLKRIESAISLMVKTFANLLSSDGVQSGEAKLIDRQVGAMMLKTISLHMQSVEYKLYNMFCLLSGEVANPEFVVSYFKDFDLGSITDYVTQATSVLGLPISDEAKKEIRIDVVRKILGSIDNADLATVLVAEMNNNPTTVTTTNNQLEEVV